MQTRTTKSARSVFCNTKFFLAIFLAILVSISGCGGGGTSTTGGGGVSFSSSKSMVRGNVSSIGASLTKIESSQETNIIASVFSAVVNNLISTAHAEGRVLAGIEVCIVDRCTLTDTNGKFELDLTGYAAATYTIVFSLDGRSYSSEIDVTDDAIVILENVSIADDGVVRVNNIRIVLLVEDTSEEGPTDEEPIEEDELDPEGEVPVVKVAICHRPGTPAQRTLNLPESALNGHLGHGDVLGECPTDE